MNEATLITLVAAVVVVVVLAALLVAATTSQRRLRAALDLSRADVTALRASIEELTLRVDAQDTAPAGPGTPRHVRDAPSGEEYVITTLPDGTTRTDLAVRDAAGSENDRLVEAVSARVFASVALGESLVRIASFGYGVRRALSPENRNRIAFEMRREVKRARRERRRELKEAKRHLRAEQRAHPTEDAA